MHMYIDRAKENLMLKLITYILIIMRPFIEFYIEECRESDEEVIFFFLMMKLYINR